MRRLSETLSKTATSSRNDGFLHDLLAGLGLWHAWIAKGWFDIVLRYRRTVVGPFWMVLSTGVMIACLSIIAPVLFGGSNPNFIPYLATGLISWNFLALSISELSASFIEHGEEIRTVRLPYSIYVYRVIVRNLASYAHLLTIYIVVALAFQLVPFRHLPIFVLGLGLIVLNLVWIGFLFGILCARFRDVQQIIGSILTIGFLLTPVFWDKSLLLGHDARSLVVHLNPLAHMLEVLRAPLLQETPAKEHYLFLVASLAVGFPLVAWLYRRSMRRIVYWL